MIYDPSSNFALFLMAARCARKGLAYSATRAAMISQDSKSSI